MIYARPGERVFITKKDIRTKTVLSKKAKDRRAYLSGHTLSIMADSSTGEYRITVQKRATDE